MSEVENLTPFATAILPSMSFKGAQLLVLVVSARYRMPPPATQLEPQVADEQPPVLLADEYWGDPGSSSLRWEGQGVHLRPGADIYVTGHAWSPGGGPVSDTMLGVSVGPCRRAVQVFGDRYWRAGMTGLAPSAARPFTTLPLLHERCFGGASSEFNPVGCGQFERMRDAQGQPLPNFEDPRDLVRSLRSRPTPAGLGPIPRNWRPRRDFGGTYDQHWRETRAPHWPLDVDSRLMNAAAPGLVATSGLHGGEAVNIVGMHPDGPISFALPRLRIRAKFLGSGPPRLYDMRIDALHLEPDELSFTLYSRAAVAVEQHLFEYEQVVVRVLNGWES